MTIISLLDWINNNRRTFLVGLFFVGLLVRCIFILVYPGVNYYAGSSLRYMHIAQNLLNGHGLSVLTDTSRISSPARQFVYQAFVDKPAGYPLFLATLLEVFGNSTVAVQIAHAALLSLLGPLFFLLAERLSNNDTYAVLCGMLAALWPNTARFDVVILPEPLVALPIAIVLFMLARKVVVPTHRWKIGIFAGVVTGLGVLLRPDLALWPSFLFIGIALIHGLRYSLILLVPYAVGMLLIVSAQTIYNYSSTGGKLIPLGYSNGIAAFEGISQFGDTLGTVYSDDRLKLLEDQSDLYYPRGPERDMVRTAKAIEIIKDRPIWYLTTVVKRIPILLTPRGLFVIDDDTPTQHAKDDFTQKFPASLFHEFSEDPVGASVKVLSALLGLALLFFAALGCWKWRRQWRIWGLPFTVVSYFVLSHIPLNVEPRYFYPATPFLLLLAGTFFVQTRSISSDRLGQESNLQ